MRCLLLLAIAALGYGQDETPLFRTGVSLVKVDFQVQDGTGKDVTGLTQADVVIYDEDQRQTINEFGAEGEPVRVLLLLDVSGSMSKHLRDLGVKSTELLGALRAGDEVGLMNFATRAELIQPLTSDTKNIGAQIIGSIYKQTLGRDTLVNEALVEAAKQLRRQQGKSRRAILIVTDNEGAKGSVTNDEVVRSLHAADTVLSAVLVGDAAGPYRSARYQNPALSPPDVHRYASDTGGVVASGSDPVQALLPVLKELTTRYSLQYTAPPAEDGTFRRIRLELTPEARAKYPGAKINARSGYTAGQARTTP